MRYREFKEQEELGPVAVANTSTVATQQPNLAVTQQSKRIYKGVGPFVFDNVKYANKAEQEPIVKNFYDILKQEFPLVKVNNELEDVNDGKKIPHIRILYALPRDKVLNTLIQNGYQLVSTNNPVQIVSGQYQNFIYTFTKNGIVFTVVVAGKGSSSDVVGQEGKCQVGIQMLRPEKFGLIDVDLSKLELIDLVKNNIQNVIKSDTLLQQALIQLIDVASGKRESVNPELMDHIAPCLKQISQDFGEILTPIVLAKKNEKIKFSGTSNKPLIDVYVGGIPVSVKSLGGSGNSFASIIDLINNYEEQMSAIPGWEEGIYFKIIKDFIGKIGNTKDKLIKAAQNAAIPEAVTLNSILNATPQNYIEMEKAVSQLIDNLKSTPEGQQNLYAAYLKTIKPAAEAAGRTKGKSKNIIAVGLPADYKKYVNDKTDTDTTKQSNKNAGKKKFDANFIRAASRQLTYMLGVGFRNSVIEGKKAIEMEETITNIMTKSKAMAAKITISPTGAIDVIRIPFSNLKFGYQYHAGTDTVDQNAPGFHIRFS